MSVFHTALRKSFGTFILDQAVPRGWVPLTGPARACFHLGLKNRDVIVAPGHPLFPIMQFPEWDSTFALSRSSLLWLWKFMQRTRPRAIIEMGGGRSTVMFSLYAEHVQRSGTSPPIIVSIDHDADWQLKTKAFLESAGFPKHVRHLLAPVTLSAGSPFQDIAYDIDPVHLQEAVGTQGVDMVLIDGPSDAKGRGNTLPAIIGLLNQGANVFLDDADRELEQAAVNQWCRMFPSRIRFRGTLPLVSGLAWLEIHTGQ